MRLTTVGVGVDSWALLFKCELCGCLVDASTLRALDYLAVKRAGTLRRVTQLACADAAACYARTLHPDRWVRVGGVVSLGEPEVGAALLRCQVCDAPAAADELLISRDEDEEGWWEVVVCADWVACDARQCMGLG
jgi:hypothetical protein